MEAHGSGMAGLGDAVVQFLRMDGLDLKLDRFREELAGRIDGLDLKLSRHFLWLLGMQVTVLLAITGALRRG